MSPSTYRIGPRVLLDSASAAINGGHRVGLVGRNGTGKTTLLRLITGALSASGGDIEIPTRWHVGITSQEAPNGPQSLIETVMAAAVSVRASATPPRHRLAHAAHLARPGTGGSGGGNGAAGGDAIAAEK